PIFVKLFVAKRRREWRSGPFLWIKRLSVVVCVENDSARRTGRSDLAEDYGVATRDCHQLRLHATFFHHLGDGCGIALDVGAVGGNVGYGQQSDKFVNDSPLVLLAPPARRNGRRVGRRKSLSCESCGEQAQQKDVTLLFRERDLMHSTSLYNEEAVRPE